MLVHIVLWRVAGTSADEKQSAADAAKAHLLPLSTLVPGVRKLRVGINCIDSATSADVVLYTEFADQDALQAYQQHPQHLRVASQVAPLVTERRVIDYLEESPSEPAPSRHEPVRHAE